VSGIVFKIVPKRVKKMKLQVKYLENGKDKTTTINGSAEEIELWNRQRDGQISIVDVKRKQ